MMTYGVGGTEGVAVTPAANANTTQNTMTWSVVQGEATTLRGLTERYVTFPDLRDPNDEIFTYEPTERID